MKQTKLFNVTSYHGLKIGNIVRFKRPYSEYEKNLKLKIIRFVENGFINCFNIENENSFYRISIKDVEKID